MIALLFPLAFLLISIKYFRDLDDKLLKIVAGLFILSLVIPYGWAALKSLDQSIWLSQRIRTVVSSVTIISAATLTVFYLLSKVRPKTYKVFSILAVAIVAIPLLLMLISVPTAFEFTSYAMVFPLITFAYITFGKRFQQYEEVPVLSLFGILALLAVVTQAFSLATY